MTRRGETGSASLLVVSLVGVLLLIGSALGVVAAMVTAHRTAESAADLAALAGAADRQEGGVGCEAAGSIATANGARLLDCRLEGDDVVVTVEVAGPHWLGQRADLQAEARAGPG